MQLAGLSGTIPGGCLDNSLLLTCQRLHGSTEAVALRRPDGVPSLTTIEQRYRVPRVKLMHHFNDSVLIAPFVIVDTLSEFRDI